ncbi:MAG: DEAD/DEAH box helicase family protein [Pirellulales bacterium]
MSSALPDRPWGESDTRSKLIDPAIRARGWTEEHIRREETAGAIEIINDKPRRRSKGRVDYTLRIKVTSGGQPVAVAVIEAKAENLPPNHGLEQAKSYARCKRLNVPFAFASNGHLFVEFDRFTQLTSQPRPMVDFPTCDELQARYETGMGFTLSEDVAKPLITPYAGGQSKARYYQDAAIRAVFEKVAKAEKDHQPKRALLSLATGSGKTIIAALMLKRLDDAGQLGRALFVCDRDELRTQGLGKLQNEFGNDVAAVSTRDPQKNARIIVATYQTLGVDSDEADANFLLTHYPENFFSHIVIDECHRSAWGKWSQVLTRNPNAVQIGLTATPREIEIPEDAKAHPDAKADAQITADNLKYFGEPVYEYSLGQGIEDGYLAACDIKEGRVNLDDTGITLDDIMARNPVDAITGQPVTRDQLAAQYEATSYERRVILPDRVEAMCRDLLKYLIETGGPEQKTVIFCATDRHADDVAAMMNNLYVAWCRKQGKQPLDAFAFKCTAAGGKDYLSDLKGATRSHFVACTVDLLTTGVDIPPLRNIVFFKYVHSPISLYQMVGRGTRIDVPTGKLMFRIYDYTGATNLFGRQFITPPPPEPTGGPGGPDPPPPPPPQPRIIVEGFEVVVTEAGHSIPVEVNGVMTKITVEEYKERLARRLIEEAADISDFRGLWIVRNKRLELFGRLPDAGRSPLLVRALERMDDYDLYDVLADLGYGLDPKTRLERGDAFFYKHAEWLAGLPTPAANTLEAIVAQFRKAGTDGLESPDIFNTPEVRQAGGKDGPIKALRELGKPADVLLDTKARLFAA